MKKFNHLIKKPENLKINADKFIKDAPLQTMAIDEKKQIREKNFILNLNQYELDLINRVFEKNIHTRSRAAMIRSILIPTLEKMDRNE